MNIMLIKYKKHTPPLLQDDYQFIVNQQLINKKRPKHQKIT